MKLLCGACDADIVVPMACPSPPITAATTTTDPRTVTRDPIFDISRMIASSSATLATRRLGAARTDVARAVYSRACSGVCSAR
jgi:hypothetical protein